MIFESINTNELGYIIAPSDISPGNVWNLATPELEECFVYPTYWIWHEVGRLWHSHRWREEARPHQCRECMSYFNEANQRGIEALIALTPNLSVSDGADDAILSMPVLEGV